MSEKKLDDLAQAREFLADVSVRLGVSPAVIEQVMPQLLGLTKRVAHNAVRPAAPLSAFLVGLASAGDSAAVTENIARVDEALTAWNQRERQP